MNAVLRKLQSEVFVLSLKQPLDQAPRLEGFETALAGNGELEVTVDVGNDLNTLFARLSAQGIGIVSLRNKSNRLEELFIGLVESKQANGQSAARKST